MLQVMEYCAREAAQIFGGLSYSRGGQGEKVERLNREVRAMAIPGGLNLSQTDSDFDEFWSQPQVVAASV